MSEERPRAQRPAWLKVKAPGGENYAKIKNLLKDRKLHTVCEEAHCPNIGECWGCGTATFIILGDTCSRHCKFCAIGSGTLLPPDPHEPRKVAESAKLMNLKYAVVTSVTRDDLADGGSKHWAETITELKKAMPGMKVEVLTPDFLGSIDDLRTVFAAQPDVFNHNTETVPRLYSEVRPEADYNRSLWVLETALQNGMKTKTGIMLGLGEQIEEVIEVMKDWKRIGVAHITIGQYLQPTKEHLPVHRYVEPQEFAELARIATEMGFEKVESGPLVRSSYHAER